MSKLTKIAPAWHAEAAAELNKDFTDINALEMTAAKRRTYLGLKFIYVKEKGKADQSIPHGQFEPWLEKNCANIPRTTIGDYITEANSVCERMGWQKSDFRIFEIPPHKLLEMPKDDLKPKDQKAQQLLFDLVECNGKFRRVTEYKQVKEGADVGERTTARGQQKGSKGLTKVMRLNAKFKDEEERMQALAVNVPMVALWIKKNLNPLGFDSLVKLPGGKEKLAQIREAFTDAHLYFAHHDKQGGGK